MLKNLVKMQVEPLSLTPPALGESCLLRASLLQGCRNVKKTLKTCLGQDYVVSIICPPSLCVEIGHFLGIKM